MKRLGKLWFSVPDMLCPSDQAKLNVKLRQCSFKMHIRSRCILKTSPQYINRKTNECISFKLPCRCCDSVSHTSTHKVKIKLKKKISHCFILACTYCHIQNRFNSTQMECGVDMLLLFVKTLHNSSNLCLSSPVLKNKSCKINGVTFLHVTLECLKVCMRAKIAYDRGP